MSAPRIVLLTGFPSSPLAPRIARQLLDEDEGTELRCVVSPTQTTRAELLVRSFPEAQRRRIRLLEGEPWGLDLGLSGREWKALTAEITLVHHAAQVTQSGLARSEAMRVNRASTAEALELARESPRLERFVLWSSASVSGSRRGFVLEDELDLAAPIRSDVEESLRRSERLVRAAMESVPSTVLRPGMVIGDSRTGELDRMEGMYLLVLLMLNAPPDRPMPMPVGADVPLPIVPIDYVVSAGLAIANDPRSVGRSFHLVDPDPLTAERVFELLARSVGRSIPRSFLPPFLANRLMRLPGLQPGGSQPLPRTFLEQLATEVVYDDHGARHLLGGTGVRCPPFESYVETLVRHVRERQLGAPATPRDTTPSDVI